MPHSRDCIIILVPGFPADERDTTCLPAIQAYVAACAAHHPDRNVHVIAFQYPFTRRKYRWNGATVHALAGRNRRGTARLRTWRWCASEVRSITADQSAAVLHSFWLTECALVGQWLSRRLGIPHIASIGGQDARGSNPYLRLLPLRKMMVTAGSRFVADEYRRSTGRDVDTVIPLGLDTKRLEHMVRPSDRDIDVLGVGSLTPLKDFATFIDVCRALTDAHPSLRACIIGKGPERDTLKRRIEAKGLQDNVRLMGELPRPECYRMMLRSRILLHPSQYESQGYVFLEAAHAGTAIVCRDVGTARDDRAAIRCATKEEMAAAVKRLLDGHADDAPRSVPTVEETVGAFDKLFRKIRPRRRVAFELSPSAPAG